MYLNYYSKMRNTISGNYEDMVAQEQNKIVTKIIEHSNWSGYDKAIFRNKAHALELKIQRWIRDNLTNGRTINDYYITFRIPKHSGGYRTLHAPTDSLKKLQKQIMQFLIEDCKLLCHNAVHSYVRHRNCKTALETHQKSGARWFLKLDIKDFFDNCTYSQVVTAVQNMHPLGLLEETKIRTILCVCFLNNTLPQGAPTSPILSNLMLQAFDYAVSKELRGYTYTRYADDLLFSKTTSFKYQDVVQLVTTYLPEGLRIKREKMRYGSCNGNNWNLGLMYNKDREITVGYRNKHLIKNKIHNLFTEPYNTYEEEQRLLWCQRLCELKGVLAYYTFIEPEYFTTLINKYKDKGYEL